MNIKHLLCAGTELGTEQSLAGRILQLNSFPHRLMGFSLWKKFICGPSDAALSDQIMQSSCCIWYTGRAALQCAFSCVCWAHPNRRMSTCIPSRCICRAFLLDPRKKGRLVMLQGSMGQRSWKWMEKKKGLGLLQWDRERQTGDWKGCIGKEGKEGRMS